MPHGCVHVLQATLRRDYCSWTDLYLPNVVLPERYTIMLKTSMAPPYLVVGSVQIQVVARELTQCVVLHAAGMNITAVQLLVPTDMEQDEVVEGEHLHFFHRGRAHLRVHWWITWLL
jgi:hypothetical protein